VKRLLAVIISCVLLFFAGSFAGCGSAYEREYYKDGDIVLGLFYFEVWLLGKNSPAVYKQMCAELEVINADIILTAPSPLKYLNDEAGAGEPVEVSRHTYELVKLSEAYYHKTGGAFNIAVQKLSELWNVDATRAGYFMFPVAPDVIKLPDVETVNAAKSIYEKFADTSTPFGVEASQEGAKYYLKKLDKDIKLDFGAVAKGYAVEVCMDIAKKSGIRSALVSFAGHNKFYGRYYDAATQSEEDWTVGVNHSRSHGERANPFFWEPETLFATSVPGEMSAIVSGDYQRYYLYPYVRQGEAGEPVLDENGKKEYDFLPVCHIINPFTGMPVGVSFDGKRYVYDDAAVVSAAIFDSSAVAAEGYATAACVKSFEEAKTLLADKGIKGAVVTAQKIAFIGIAESDLLTEYPENATYKRYGEPNIEFVAF